MSEQVDDYPSLDDLAVDWGFESWEDFDDRRP